MIVDKYVKTCVSGGSINFLKNIGYDVKFYDRIEIPIEHLSVNSHVKINCKCDICGNIKNMTYQTYLNKIKFDQKYYCYKCSHIKRTKVIIEKYGVNNVFQLEDTKIKMKKSFIDRYGADHPLKNKDVIDHMKATNIKKYGCENVFQNDDIKNKIIIDNIKKYGVEHLSRSPDMYFKKLLMGKKIKKYKDLYYQSGYEKDFIDFCLNNNILKYVSKPKIAIKYIHNNKLNYYHPDFHIEKLNLFIEIKSDYWWNKLLEINLIKEKSDKFPKDC